MALPAVCGVKFEAGGHVFGADDAHGVGEVVLEVLQVLPLGHWGT